MPQEAAVRKHIDEGEGTTQWSTALSSKVNLHTAIDLRGSCGTNLVTYPAEFRRVETRVLRAGGYLGPGIPEGTISAKPFLRTCVPVRVSYANTYNL